MKTLLLLLAATLPMAASTVTLTGAQYTTDGFTFIDASSLSPVYVPSGTVEVAFIGTITNTDPDHSLYLNDQSAASLSSGLTLDTNYFFNTAGGTLDASGTSDFDHYTGGIFGIFLDAGLANGTYTGTYSVLGGLDDTSTDLVGSVQNFSIVVTPEPGTWALLFSALGATALLRKRLESNQPGMLDHESNRPPV